MTLNYHQYQEEVFNFLWKKNQQDADFTFTVRQKASKGAETNYFIGTEKSKYFAFTCWDIPVFFPGSSADLTNFIFWKGADTYHFKFQYLMAKTATGTQSDGDLYLGKVFIEKMEQAGIGVKISDGVKKMLYVQIFNLIEGYKTIEELAAAFEIQYNLLDPILNSAILETKLKHKEWLGGKLASSKFMNMVKKMHERIEKFKNFGELSADEIGEELLVSETPIDTEIQSIPLNQILYGPAGTGKTYTTLQKAVQIANPEFDILNNSRAKLRGEYKRLIKDGQIEFITFHQSLSYEDFIEGIKPMEPKQDDTYLKYEITPGIFKRLAERAAKVPDTKPTGFSINDNDFNKASFYKISLGDTSNPDDDQIYEWCIKNGYIGLGWGDAIDFTGKTEHEIQLMVPSLLDKFGGQAVNYFIHFLKEGDYVIVSYGNRAFRAIGRIKGGYEFKNVEGLNIHQFRSVDWLLADVELPCEEVYNKQFSQQSIYRLDKREIKKDFFVNTKTASIIEDKPKNYVLIIDEINRGNVSQIFGELITLIEEDKRTGNKEALSVTLPYSKKSFSVPANLYLIGTMNTADRSVEALDTALRRRFVFEEMLSDETLLSPFKLLQRLWLKYWGVKEGDEKWNDWEKEHDSLIELAGFNIDDDEYYTMMEKYEDEETEAEWLNKNPKEVFKNIIAINENGIDLEKLLLAINIRLKTLLTKDHSIGHAWLMEIYSLAGLQSAFKNKIIPLLQEFFYNDYAKIGLVLGDAFVQQTAAGSKIFAKFNDSTEIATEYENKFVYTLINPLEIDTEGFKSIYK